MDLYDFLNNYSIEDVLSLEQKDLQFIAIKKIFDCKNLSHQDFLFLILVNSLVCYQLSGKGELYWQEFGEYFSSARINNSNSLKNEFKIFLKNSKNNKRLLEVKLSRVDRIFNFYDNFCDRYSFYYKDMVALNFDLASFMNQKINAKTIVFAVKMFGYGARIVFGYIEIFPKSIDIPLDSRLDKIYKIYGKTYKTTQEFYTDLSNKLNIPKLHLDTLLWTKYNQILARSNRN